MIAGMTDDPVGVSESLQSYQADSGVGLRVEKRDFKQGNSPSQQSEVIILAKDGTNRGGARIGAGAKKKPLADKIAEGNPGGRTLTVMEFSNTVDLHGQAMPEPNKMLEAVQKDGKTLVAGEIYKNTWQWLNERGCAMLISPQLLERYAMSVARWIQCEEAVTEYGFLAKHPTTGNAIQSPYVAMGQNYMNQTNRLWMEIFQIVKESCTGEYSGTNPQDDVMERLLTARKGK